jgi:twitching motility protein PilT
MTGTPAIRALIRDDKLHNIDNQIQMGAKYGMQTMNQSLVATVKSGMVSEEIAMQFSLDTDDFKKSLLHETQM